MRAIEVTHENVRQVMAWAGIDKSMLIKDSATSLCKLTDGSYCNDECNKYGLSACEHSVGNNRDGACVLYRLYMHFNNQDNAYELFAPIESISCEIEDI